MYFFYDKGGYMMITDTVIINIILKAFSFMLLTRLFFAWPLLLDQAVLVSAQMWYNSKASP